MERINKGIRKDFLFARMYGVFLSGLCFMPEIAQNVLLKNNFMEMIAGMLFQRSEVYLNSYDKKVILNIKISFLYLPLVHYLHQV